MTTVLDHLSILLKGELQASSVYFMHYKILQHQGWPKLAEQEKKNYLEEINHAEEFIDRIFFLNGNPGFIIEKVETGHNIESILAMDMKLEQDAINNLKDGIDKALIERDYGTVELLYRMLADEESHVDWINTQHNSLKILGVEKYLQKYG